MRSETAPMMGRIEVAEAYVEGDLEGVVFGEMKGGRAEGGSVGGDEVEGDGGQGGEQGSDDDETPVVADGADDLAGGAGGACGGELVGFGEGAADQRRNGMIGAADEQRDAPAPGGHVSGESSVERMMPITAAKTTAICWLADCQLT